MARGWQSDGKRPTAHHHGGLQLGHDRDVAKAAPTDRKNERTALASHRQADAKVVHRPADAKVAHRQAAPAAARGDRREQRMLRLRVRAPAAARGDGRQGPVDGPQVGHLGQVLLLALQREGRITTHLMPGR